MLRSLEQFRATSDREQESFCLEEGVRSGGGGGEGAEQRGGERRLMRDGGRKRGRKKGSMVEPTILSADRQRSTAASKSPTSNT